eukprot:6487080-Amphidinium_carterae.1
MAYEHAGCDLVHTLAQTGRALMGVCRLVVHAVAYFELPTCDPLKVFAALREFDMAPEWVPYVTQCQESKILQVLMCAKVSTTLHLPSYWAYGLQS